MQRRSFPSGNGMNRFRIFLVGSLLTFAAFTSSVAADKQTIEAEAGELIGGATKAANGAAAGGSLVVGSFEILRRHFALAFLI